MTRSASAGAPPPVGRSGSAEAIEAGVAAAGNSASSRAAWVHWPDVGVQPRVGELWFAAEHGVGAASDAGGGPGRRSRGLGLPLVNTEQNNRVGVRRVIEEMASAAQLFAGASGAFGQGPGALVPFGAGGVDLGEGLGAGGVGRGQLGRGGVFGLGLAALRRSVG